MSDGSGGGRAREPAREAATPAGILPYGRQDVTEADIEAVLAVLRSPWLTQGPKIAEFESAIAARCEVPHAVAVNSATAALHIACRALGVGPGDWVWTSPNTFVASANCARYCGAEVDFVDIDPVTYNLCPQALADKLTRAQAGALPLPKVVIPVHFAGQPCDMGAIGALAEEYGFHVLEDASHAIGAHDGHSPVGACRHGDATVFSFHPVKIVTSGEGGAVTTRSAALAERMRRLRTHGIVRDAGAQSWLYAQHELGYNYRMCDLQAALGISQLTRLESYVRHRHALAERYDALLAGTGVTLPGRPGGSRSALHLYPILVGEGPTASALRETVFIALRAAGIGVNVHYIPVHTQPYYRARGHARDPLGNALDYYARAISLPLFGAMTFEEQDRVVSALHEALDGIAGREGTTPPLEAERRAA